MKAVNFDLYSGHPITTVLQPKWPYRLRRDIITILRPNLHRTGHHTGFSVRTVLAGHILTDAHSDVEAKKGELRGAGAADDGVPVRTAPPSLQAVCYTTDLLRPWLPRPPKRG